MRPASQKWLPMPDLNKDKPDKISFLFFKGENNFFAQYFYLHKQIKCYQEYYYLCKF